MTVEEKFLHYVQLLESNDNFIDLKRQSSIELIKCAGLLTLIDVLDTRLGGRMV